jgi:hypothetical protein
MTLINGRTGESIITGQGSIQATLKTALAGKHRDFRGVILSDDSFRCIEFNGVDLSGGFLDGCKFVDCIFKNCELDGVSFVNSYLTGSKFISSSLKGANFTNARLIDTLIVDSKINGLIGNAIELKSMQVETYQVAYYDNILAIGCEQKTIEEWKNITREELIKLDGFYAVSWWKKWEDVIFKSFDIK